MVKIWECDFTKFDPPTSTSGVDNVGNQNLNSPVSISKAASMPGFNFRPGLIWGSGGIANYYDLKAGGNTRADWNSNYSPTNKRSFVMWIYPRYTPDDGASMWGSSNNAGDDACENGWRCGTSVSTDEDLYYRYNDGSSALVYTDFFLDQNWHCLVATIDRINGQQRVYIDTSLVFSTNDSGNLPSTNNQESRIGCWGDAYENAMYLGQVSTYDHILDTDEIDEIYNTFLRDAAGGDAPLHVISGTIFGEDLLPVSGATVYLLRESSNYIEYYTQTTSGGQYEVPISYSGAYTLVATSVPNPGGRAQPFIATTSGLEFL